MNVTQAMLETKTYASCANNDGSLACACKDGFSGDGEYRMDNDECNNNPGGEQKCANTVSSFSCDCPFGFIGEGTTCVDVDECDDSPCNSNATCSNSDGSFNRW